MKIINEKQLAELIRIEAVKLLVESSKRSVKFIQDAYVNWKLTYPYGQFNKLPNEIHACWEKDAEILKNIYDTAIEEYLKNKK